ncbi:hypothetical protein KZ483_10760 [Paenibacillus sp. sptzw28]|uniref:hypothetical protein n=1 Tax=Paenibacillus sp. sptzw28 TaxID=715179 RepID=UPI001C6EE904|nr:hypothetical protein [Paenibacillus sp. sptzw28]QYR23345.1 hypothetical protein KZ483_10760 [Paenibacillus sp. sptzw28]
MNVTNAHVRRTVERDGVRCCEVEVHTGSSETPELLAFFSESLDNDYDMVAVIKNEAATEIDWFDNNLHNAFTEISVDLFETVTMKTDWGRRETFKQQILSYPGVRAELSSRLGGS